MHRSLTIKTDPPGALVYLNDQLKGESPTTFDFLWYGWHRVMVRKEGFERIEDRKRIRCPLYLWIPFDLAMELAPFPIRHRLTWSYTLTPIASPPMPAPPASTKSTTITPTPPAAADATAVPEPETPQRSDAPGAAEGVPAPAQSEGANP